MQHRTRLLSAAVLAAGFVLVGCESDQEVSPDPDGLQEPGDAPEGADTDGLGDAEDGTGEPAIEGDSEGRLDPDSLDEEE